MAARDPARHVRPRAAGGPAEDLAPRAVRPRRLAVRLLRHDGRPADARPRGPAQPRRRLGLGERRHLLRAVQPAARATGCSRRWRWCCRPAAAACAGALHPARHAEDPDRLAAVPRCLRRRGLSSLDENRPLGLLRACCGRVASRLRGEISVPARSTRSRHKWVVLGFWLVRSWLGCSCSSSAGATPTTTFSFPGRTRRNATDLLTRKFPPQQNGSSPVVFYSKTSQGHRQEEQAGDRHLVQDDQEAAARLQRHEPLQPAGKAQISKDKHTAFISVLLSVGSAELTDDIANSVLDAAAPGESAGMQVAVGGPIGSELSEPSTESSDVIGLAVAMIILAFTFGTFVAMGDADPLGGSRPRVWTGPHRAPRARGVGAVDRSDARNDDRPRRRDRLRALHGLALPREPKGRHGVTRGARARRRDVREARSSSPAEPW